MLKQTVIAEMRRMGKQYPHLEAVMQTMTEPQLRDILNLIRDVGDNEKSHMRRMALQGRIF
jgi:hypothetical protein